ncbi:bifunctional Pyridoxal phosphate-dependent transferase/Pyridoxal phosphate-dependent transferase [Babesia duncani]|uniref:Bifunctional Pyridoxal phosphate-dependent transferase/Pyridoxal phosphate-dependent transferase n=1 Tax=Babesia duncani TaxID=323732 RepID=A0AAD9UMU7_9APIC|nr:bifunctional Pyridoxal phosphate-dependent transferase/Pyridoxal phosphate-dependent transferase [Babesia duncani]
MPLLIHLVDKPLDSNFSVAKEAKEDKSNDKLDLTLGAYRNAENLPVILDSVSLAKKAISHDPKEYEEYLPLAGHVEFTAAARDLLFKHDCPLAFVKQCPKCEGNFLKLQVAFTAGIRE